ncbi:hypothetical protein Cgig2_014411 [Carnegiea gigantea]|uniref:Uncharacterized protein n=1 Tax=Carnegiea gigantea TaxID=171969 RepID=A0A9Q1JHN2_9CARY|nr:hypothetical protein Cgig2_014411 [Carnegiea gigantea]
MECSYLSFLGLDGILLVEKTRGGHLPQILTRPRRPVSTLQGIPSHSKRKTAPPSKYAPPVGTSELGEDFDLGIVRVDLEGLHDFDVRSLCQPQIGEIDVFDSDVEENLEQASDEESDHDDSEDEEFDSLSLDKDDDLQDENESLDDVDLENDTQLHITIGHDAL